MSKKILAALLAVMMVLSLVSITAFADSGGGGDTIAAQNQVIDATNAPKQAAFAEAYDPETGKLGEGMVAWTIFAEAVDECTNAQSETKTKLTEYYNKIEKLDLSGIAAMADTGRMPLFIGLKELNISNTGFIATNASNQLHALSGICTNLESLDISGCTGIEVLSGLNASDRTAIQSSLKTLKAANIGATDISPVTALTNLEILDVSGVKIAASGDGNTNLPVASLTGLQELYAADTGINNIGSLVNHASLKKLDISDNNISGTGSLAALSSCTALEELDLSNNENLPSDAGWNSLTDLALKKLDVSGTGFPDIGDLTTGGSNKIKNSLEELDISDTPVTKIETIVNVSGTGNSKTVTPNFPALKILNAKNLKLESISGLVELICTDDYKGNKKQVTWNLGGSNVKATSGKEDELALHLWWLSAELGEHWVPPTAEDAEGKPIEGAIPRSYTSALNWKAAIQQKLNPSDGTGLTWKDIINATYWYDTAVAEVASFSNTDTGIKPQLQAKLDEIKAYYASIQKLNLSGQKITDSGFEGTNTGALKLFTGLTDLNLSSTGITEIGAVEKMTGLKELDISNNAGITDIGALATLSLTNLDLSGTGVEELGSLKEAKEGETNKISASLTTLDISNSKVEDIGALAACTKLTSLKMNNVPLKPSQATVDKPASTNLGALKTCTALTTLEASNCGITTVGGLENCTALTTLDVSYNKLDNMGALASCTALTSLDVSYNTGIDNSDLGALVGLPLEILDLSHTSITDIGGLTGTTDTVTTNTLAAKLETLDISGTKITKIESVWDGAKNAAAFPNLTTLTAQDLKLTSISGLAAIASQSNFTGGKEVLWDLHGSTLTNTEANRNSVKILNDADKTDSKFTVSIADVSGGNTSSGTISFTTPTTVTVPSATGGKVSVSSTTAKQGSTITINTTPDAGKKVGSVTVTDKNGKTVTVTEVGNGKYTFVVPAATPVTVKVTFVDTIGIEFVDVPADAYYADAINWAVEKGISVGTTATTFSPNNPCTRGQMVEFLYRAAGKPAVSGTNAFTDIPSNAYYKDAVQWAVTNNITKGTSATAFSPNEKCTRGQMATFLYRYAKQPAVSGSNAFTDIPANAFYKDAVQWAVNEGITVGTSATTFSPNGDCTRGQMVTFLYRFLGK